MAARTQAVLSAGTGLVATLVLGLSVLVTGATISTDPVVTGLWWAAYLAYVAVFLLDDELLPVRRPWPARVSPVLLLLLGLAVWFLAPGLGWSALLFVITAGAAAFELAPRTLVPIVLVQTAAIVVGSLLAGWEAADVLFQALAYLAFQGFAALVVAGTRREAEARTRLAVAHAELRATAALLESSTRSAERVRIARDLHDVVGHGLTALSLELELASHQVAGAGEESVRRAQGIARDLLGDVRGAVSELRDREDGLEPALRAMVADLSGLDVSLTVEQFVPLDDARRTAVIRTVQEMITNVLRHADASCLGLSVVAGADGTVIRAHDDGRGAEAVRPGHGLTGMAERAAELGGILSTDTAPGKGFTVVVRVPAA